MEGTATSYKVNGLMKNTNPVPPPLSCLDPPPEYALQKAAGENAKRRGMRGEVVVTLVAAVTLVFIWFAEVLRQTSAANAVLPEVERIEGYDPMF